MPLTPEEEAQLAAEEEAGLFDNDSPGGGSSAGTLALPVSPEAIVWSEFARLVRESLGDLPVNVSVRSWDGSEGDFTETGPPPWIRLSPSSGKPTPYAMGILATPIVVHVDLKTAGPDVADSFNLWHSLDSVIRDPAFRVAMTMAGAADVRATEAAAGVRRGIPKDEPTDEGTIFAAGTIEIRIYRRV
jgi:hypothetical protein